MTQSTELTSMTATEVVEQLRRGDLSPMDLLDAVEARAADVDGEVNALCTLCFDRARDNAKAMMARPVSVHRQDLARVHDVCRVKAA